MKSSKIILAFLILSAIKFCFGQDASPKFKLTDEFGTANCEEVLARVDNFMIDIQNSPGSIGYAVIYPQKGNIKEASERQTWIEGNTAFRKFYADRLLIVRGEERETLQVQFWLVPAGAVKPDLIEGKWSYFTKDLSKAFVFSTSIDFLVCPGNYARSYVDFLMDNPGTRGHIVIFNKSGRYDRAEVESVLKNLTDGSQLNRSRLKVFFAKQKVISDIELWVVPPRKN